MKELFSLGKIYPSDFLKDGEKPRCEPVEMKLMLTDDGLVRLEKTAPKEAMYGKYWYRSGINQTMKDELKNIVDSIFKLIPLVDDDMWLDIACNDGTLLSYVTDELYKICFDPADDVFKEQSLKVSDKVYQDYFSSEKYLANNNKKSKVVTSIAMFYDLDDPEKFIKDVYDVLDDNGLWVMQLSYTPLMLQQLAFDNICHEHIYYYSLFNLKNILEKNGFKVMDCLLNDINGGSMRVYITKANCKPFISRPQQDVCNFRIASLLAAEKGMELDNPKTWVDFYSNILRLKNSVREYILELKQRGHSIWAYGASTKGNTLLQYFGLDNTLIDGIADRSEYKWGLRTVGTSIPIYSEKEMRRINPDYLLILPWHFINEFKEREKEYLKNGGHFIVPCPTFEII